MAHVAFLTRQAVVTLECLSDRNTSSCMNRPAYPLQWPAAPTRTAKRVRLCICLKNRIEHANQRRAWLARMEPTAVDTYDSGALRALAMISCIVGFNRANRIFLGPTTACGSACAPPQWSRTTVRGLAMCRRALLLQSLYEPWVHRSCRATQRTCATLVGQLPKSYLTHAIDISLILLHMRNRILFLFPSSLFHHLPPSLHLSTPN